MSGELMNFRWGVYKDGYELSEVRSATRRSEKGGLIFGVEVDEEDSDWPLQLVIRPINPGGDITYYNPTEKISIFNEFAALNDRVSDDNFNAILEFINTYGFLQQHDNFVQSFPKGTYHNYETVEYWRQESFDMAIAVKLWTAIKNHDIPTIKRYINMQDGKWTLNYNSRREHIYASIDSTCEARKDPNYDLLFTLNQSYGLTNPRNALEAANHFLCHFCYGRTTKGLVVLPLLDQQNKHLNINIFPDCLESSIWFNFLQAVSRSLKFKQCEECTSFFEVVAAKRRYEKRFCSSRCQKRNERKRKQK